MYVYKLKIWNKDAQTNKNCEIFSFGLIVIVVANAGNEIFSEMGQRICE